MFILAVDTDVVFLNYPVSTEESSQIKPVFFDTKGRRRRTVNTIIFLATTAFTVLAGFFIVSVLINPFLPQIRLRPAAILPQKIDVTAALPATPPLTKKEAAFKQVSERVQAEKQHREEQKLENQGRREMLLAGAPAPTPVAAPGKPVAVGFYVNWDYSAFTSLKQNIDQLDWVVPEWIRLSGDGSQPLALDIDDKAIKLMQEQRPDMPILPLVQNYKDEKWNSDILVKSISTESQRQKLIGALLDTVAQNHFGGLTIDIEEVPDNAQTNLFLFVSQLHQELQKRGLILAQAVPFDNPDWNYRAFASVTDYLMLMAYDQHWSTGDAGPVAANDWFDSTLKKRMKDLSPSKTIVCVGNYGYNWSDNGDEADTVTFQEALLAAKESLDSPRDIKFDPASKNPYYTYDEEDGTTHTVWFLDAVTAYDQIKNAESYDVAGIALWRLGSEDPSLWEVWGSKSTGGTIADLETIKYGYDVDFDGNGEILQVKSVPQDGYRDLTTEDAAITGETYQQIPSSYTIQRTGDQPGKIALTFDDGPDPIWTPKILDILKAENVKATFFVLGENGQENPNLLKRIVDEGHTIGNHSFTHPNLGEVPDRVTDLELNATQRLIESVTGRSTRLFRAPYFGDAEPRNPDEVGPTVIAQNLGYISVGLHLDPDDWKLTNDDGTPHTADQMVNEVLEQVKVTDPEERGNVVLMHDSGGDRSATVAMLPKLIDELRARGYTFTTVPELAGITRDQAMPVVQEDQSFYAKTDSYIFYGMAVGGWLMRWLFLIGIVLGIGRMVVIGILALAQYLRSRRRERIHFGVSFEPLVSVVVPAFNEEKVICRTIESLLQSDYPKLEIIIVDDGSTDDTYAVAMAAFADTDLVSVYTKSNGGKAEALNFGWRKATGDIIIALDADTVFTSETVSALAHRFVDEQVGAIAGNAKVGNRVNIVTKWQALEYVTSQNFDRRAFSSLNCITVVPGAVGAWRRSVLDEIGGFSSGTLAEDQDLTIEVRKRHYRIGYEEAAVGYTEAPDSLKNLAKQRFRWSFGTLQCMWKHKGALLNPKYGTLGFVAMPNVWIFQVFFPLISPLMDLMFIWTLAAALIGYLEHTKEYAHTPTNLNQVIFYYALFLAVDWLGAFLAFLMEKAEQKKLLWWLLIQRFGYRQVMYWVMVKSVYTAVRGAIVGWGKLERKATVQAEI
jgi:cellulose synthase/poly-beta-1,6-N-acetylglucosamine synthase-like glycosyltransferase/peptidoglycan/xylan/chitin deacetylase (PgdA/CDA1 family)/spore germination protein YaaH